ncbi:homoserine O-succinyltransferase [Bacillus sp. HMF5848]|uniref:homoserine O-acetyltransferase MetA n=1 Tax=Bacillus sp. HMF5848 TaxID=2495421 RepID=UPI000F7714D3|nr:homoserine O-succinyltransferase [Bacillus sp. HMF5848]RSK27316.1 homoserine O-succinyltransferase [Bacillus sp. HMF5848]
MPINIPLHLPAREVLEAENIFVMDETRASTQDIRPLNIVILNIMPEKEKTETQLLRLLSNSPLQINVTLLRPICHESKTTSQQHLNQFYKTFFDIKHRKYDGMIITGAPIEHLPFEDVNYWNELQGIMDWTNTHVTSTLHICWGAQAALYHHYGIDKYTLSQKLSGVYLHKLIKTEFDLVRGFDDYYYVPHSRHTDVKIEDIQKQKCLQILSVSEEAGVCLVKSENGKHIFLTGHPEYEACTLKDEYLRDQAKGLDPNIPDHYFPNDDPMREPHHIWRSHAYLLFANWLNYYVYQQTPYVWE